MSIATLHRPSPPWWRLVALVLLAHALVLTALAPPRRLDSGRPAVRAWSTRAVALPTAPAVDLAAAAATPADTFSVPAPEPTLAAPRPRALRPTHTAPPTVSKSRPLARTHTTRSAPSTDAPQRAVGAVDPGPAPATQSAESSHPPSEAADAPQARPAAPPTAPADLPVVQLPGAATLSYAVSGTARGLPYAARSTLDWRPNGGRYEAAWHTEGDTPRHTHAWRSQGSVSATGLMPERFADKARSERAAHFDAAGGRIRFSANTPDVPWAPGGQDRLSAVLQLGALLAATPGRYPPGAQITLQTAGPRDADAWQWTVLDDETLTIGDQPMPCAVLHHAATRPYEASVTLWLARPLQYLPARLRTTGPQGDVVEHNLQNLSNPP